MKSITQTALFLFGCSVHQLAFSERLEDAVHTAIQTNPEIAASVQRYYGSQADQDAAFGNFLPSIDLDKPKQVQPVTMDARFQKCIAASKMIFGTCCIFMICIYYIMIV